MSSSGNDTGNSVDGPNHVYMTWSISSQSQAGNTSTIAWNMYWYFSGSVTCRQLDNGDLTLGGAVRWNDSGRVHDYSSSHSHSGNYKVASGSFTVTHDSEGNYNLSGSGGLTGYSGARSSFTTGTWALTRIPKVPAAPATPTATASGNTITVSWVAPDNNGATITSYQIQRADNSAMTTNPVTYTDTASPIAIGSLNYGQAYYVRVRAYNSVGWGPWSAVRTVTTGITVPGAPATAPTFSAISPVQATVSYVAPTFIGGSAITGYDVQRAKDAAFTVDAVTVADSASPLTLTGLLPGTTYHVRVRAKNAAGNGAWSPTGNFTTLPGAYVGNGSAWIPSLVYVGNGTSWVVAQVKSGNGTAWV